MKYQSHDFSLLIRSGAKKKEPCSIIFSSNRPSQCMACSHSLRTDGGQSFKTERKGGKVKGGGKLQRTHLLQLDWSVGFKSSPSVPIVQSLVGVQCPIGCAGRVGFMSPQGLPASESGNPKNTPCAWTDAASVPFGEECPPGRRQENVSFSGQKISTNVLATPAPRRIDLVLSPPDDPEVFYGINKRTHKPTAPPSL